MSFREDEVEDIQKVCSHFYGLMLFVGDYIRTLSEQGFIGWLFFQEIAVLSQCRSPYITEYYGSYLHQTKLWIIMEYMAGGSVADLVSEKI